MSLLTRIAQTRQGAERLIEARVLPTLAVCDFLDTRPDVDQTFIGMPLLKFRWLILIDTLARSGSFSPLRHSAVSPAIPARSTAHRCDSGYTWFRTFVRCKSGTVYFVSSPELTR